MKLDVVFVCQQGPLEVMSSLLAASLRQFCGDRVHLHVIEPIPKAVYGNISLLTRNFLDSLDVKWYQFPNPISDEYKIFNKLNAFKIRPQGEKILFLDSDIVIRRPFLQALSAYFSMPFVARSAGGQKFSADGDDWQRIYQFFDLPLPSIRWPAAVSHEWGPPYFNAGVMLVDASLDFSTGWIEACLRIHQEGIQIKKSGSVQIGLPVSLHRRNIPYALLDRRFNFGLGKRRIRMRKSLIDEEADIVHYFQPKNLCGDPVIQSEVVQIAKNFKLQDILSLAPRWRRLRQAIERSNGIMTLFEVEKKHSSLFSLRAGEDKPLGAAKPVITRPPGKSSDYSLESRMACITGIPRSGTRLFSSLFAQLPNVVTLNESNLREGFEYFNTSDQFWATWKEWRKDIDQIRQTQDNSSSGKIIWKKCKKISGGSLEQIQNSNYVLAAEHTLGYLLRLGSLLSAFPQATIFIVVRNPFDTIASWMAAPPLRNATVIEDGFADVHGPFFSAEQLQHFSELKGVNDLAMKRAGLWDFFAGFAATHSEQVHIIRYEDMEEDPEAVLRYAHGRLFPDRGNCQLPDMDPCDLEQAPKGILTAWDKECIRAICSNNAGVFDYNLYECETPTRRFEEE